MELIQQLRDEILRIWDEMDRRQKTLVGGLGVGSLLVLGFFTMWASRPEYTTAYKGLSEQDAADIVDILENQDIPYQLTEGGTTIRIPARQVDRVRLEVARQGLPRGGSVGFELFDQGGLGNLGMTQFSQRVNYQRALEGALARTISTLDAVEQARVHLVIPEKTLFTQNQTQPSASVMLSLRPGRSLSEDRIWGVSNLVASSVEGLQADNVTIVDTNGRVLATGTSEQEAASKSGLRLSMAQMDAEQEVERNLEGRLQQMLDTALGLNKALVRVNADLEWDQVEMTSEQFEPTSGGETGVIRSFRQNVESSGGITSTGGVPGVDANVLPIYQPVITGTQQGRLFRRDTTVNYEVSKTVKRAIDAPGDIKRLSVAVLLDKNDDNLIAQQPAIEEMVQAAVGYDSSRGDTVTVDFVSFNDQITEQAKAMEEAQQRAQYMQLATVGAAVLGLLILLFFVRRMFQRLEERVLTDLGPAQAPRLEASQTELGDFEPDTLEPRAAEAGQLIDLLEGAEEPDVELDLEDIRRRKRITSTAQENPEAVARVIQRWLAEEE